ncbi:hypothetical protein [Agromyces sp. Marseille-P2726]|uniref:hypothetical protein n=1 Tax=Agromyces sp. Marseille-P2726 TaxID=2709132 RepID=UPI0015712CA9|nr:hypothetical protein [Agromyces sp. Marseille-P2726]
MSAGRGEREQPNDTGGRTNPRPPVWRRAGVWAGGVAAAALATVLAGTVTQGFGLLHDLVIIQGDPVKVRIDAENPVEDVVLSSNATLSADELARLADLPVEEQVAWLQDQKQATVAGTRTFTLYLKGNRAGTVRVTDLTSSEECVPIPGGTLVRMVPGRGAGVDSDIVHIDVGEGSSDAYQADASGTKKNYFPDRTITLARDEEFPLVVHLVPDFSGSICNVRLKMTVWDGNVEHHQSVPDEGDDPFVVMSIELEENESKYGAVYLGGAICRQYVRATPNWSMSPPCGDGNFAEW